MHYSGAELSKGTIIARKGPAGLQLGVIPARYESGRFPGKPLVDILGKPMVVRTWQQAQKASSLDRVVIATDDERIADVCRKAGAEVIMTSKTCPNGRIANFCPCKVP